MSANPLLCGQVGPGNPTLWLCQTRPSAHSGPAMPGFSCGLGGASKSAWCTTLQTENNVYCSWPLAKWHCLDMTHRSYGTFKICQTNGSKIEHMSTRISQQLQMLLNLHNSPGMILASQGHTFKTQTLHSLILIYSIWMIIRFSANERITTWVGS